VAALLAAAALALSGAGPTPAAAATCDGVAPVAGTDLTGFAVVTGLAGRPLLVTAPPGDVDRIFIVEQNGPIRIHRHGDPPGVTSLFLDLTTRVLSTYNEMGLLGLAFDPDYAQNGFFYVNYTEGPLLGPWYTVVARYARSAADPDTADPASEVRIMRFQQPQVNHNGGQILFGPDGYLYVATGDGGGSNDSHGTCGNGQDRATLLGKMLRIDARGVDPAGVAPDCGGAGAQYQIPSTNPFALTGDADCGEIFAYGLRNPWRSVFDEATGDLFIADVGQNCREEINALPGAAAAGANFGWRAMEGRQCFSPVTPSNCDPTPVACPGTPACDDPSLVLPIVDYLHASGACSVTGGPVYRGCQMPDLAGTYFYGDYCAGFVRTLRLVGGAAVDMLDRTAQVDPGGNLAFGLTSFGADGRGEVYVVHRSGFVGRLGPPFTALEVSGPGAGTPFQVGAPSWTWEDLPKASGREVARYRLYRGTPGGEFTCVATSTTSALPGGDTENPPARGMFAYVVTAVAVTGEETRPGIQGTAFLPAACP
jgi:glucose/arabinose dehydrogenase